MALGIKSVLVPVDFSDIAPLVLRYGAELARDYKATLHVVTVVEASDPMIELGDPVNVRDRWRRERVEEGQTRLRSLCDGVLGGRTRTETVLEGVPPDEIVAYCENQSIDLLVVGSHGTGGFIQDWLGDVTYRVMKSATCPVLVVKPGRIEVEVKPTPTRAPRKSKAQTRPAD